MKKLRALKSLPENAFYTEIDSPVGILTVIASDKGLHAILWGGDRHDFLCDRIVQNLDRSDTHPIIKKAKKQLTEYFEGKRKNFDLPLVIEGTEFQKQAWKALQTIPYARTISYAEQAEKVGDRKKARAVGMANGSNPLSIVVPCHRVIGSSGDLTGFGGGLSTKKFLLELERVH